MAMVVPLPQSFEPVVGPRQVPPPPTRQVIARAGAQNSEAVDQRRCAVAASPGPCSA